MIPRRLVALAAAILLAAPRVQFAQDVGKIQGHVRSADGVSLPGAQLTILGSRLGNIVDADGFYFVNNVPAGLHDIQVLLIGYQRVIMREQRVLAGQTLTLDFALRRTAVEIEPLVVVGEKRPLVPRDQVTSKNIVTGDVVEELPVDNVNQILMLQPGVVVTDRPGSKGLSIRGGRSGEEAIYIDGLLVRNFNWGESLLKVGTNSLEQVDVITGSVSAEFGDAQSGVINYVTRSGGREWKGLGTFETDAFMPSLYSLGLNRAELSLDGPLPLGIGFFAAGTITAQKYTNNSRYWRSVPVYVMEGIDTVVSVQKGGGDVEEVVIPNFVQFAKGRQPYGGSDEYTLETKLDYGYGSGSRFFVSGHMSRNQARTQPLFQIYNLNNLHGSITKSRTLTAGWTHNLIRSSERSLSLDFKVAHLHDWTLGNNRDPRAAPMKRGLLGFTFSDLDLLFDHEDIDIGQHTVEAFLRNEVEKIAPFPNRTDVIRNQTYRMNPYAVTTYFSTRGLDGGDAGGLRFSEERQWQFRFAADWQINRKHRLKFGGDYFNIDVKHAFVLYTNLIGTQLWVENPKRASLFIQDRLDVGDMVVEAGLRYDRFDPNSDFPVTPGYYVPDDSSTFERAAVRHSISPRLGVSFPITVNSTVRFSYGHFTQVPDLNEYYRGKNNDKFRYENVAFAYARPLDLAKTIAFEFGFRQLLAPDFVLDIAAFTRNKMRDVSLRKLAWENPTNPGDISFMNTYTNADFGTVRGLDIRMDRRVGIFNGMVGYSFQDAQSTGTDPYTVLAAANRLSANAHVLLGLPPDPPSAMRPTEENRRHNFSGTFSIRFPAQHENPLLRQLGWFATARMSSGMAYTRVKPFGEARDDEISTGRTPWQHFVDMRFTKGLVLQKKRVDLVLDARNIFDLENIRRLHPSTDGLWPWWIDFLVEAQRAVLSGGAVREVINLQSRDSAGLGVTNDADLVLLRRAEKRFGNGDLLFSAEEQDRAFRAAETFIHGPQNLIAPGRRLRMGIEISL